MKREKHLETLTSRKEPWDIVIIGGGASGLGAAVDAANRGHKTLLLEKHDFAKGTSSRSTKLVHGGVRYLQNGNISLVMEALKERGLMRKNAPHLVQDLKFIIPSYSWWNMLFYGIGLKIYDMMSGRRSLGKSKILSKKQTMEALSNVQTKGLRGGVLYHDGQFDDARMAISLAQTAENKGACLLNYCGVTRLIKENNKITGVWAKDKTTGAEYAIKTKVVINATGVFSDKIIRLDRPESKKSIVPSQGVHIVLDRSFLKGECAMMIPRTTDGRVLFAVPWNQYVVVGTTDILIKKPMKEPIASAEEINFILDNAAAYMSKPPKHSDIKSIFSGLRPLALPDKQGSATKEISRGHKIMVSDTGLISILGGKWTTYRRMSEDLINTAQSIAGLPQKECTTDQLPIHGYDQNTDWTHPMHVYGADIKKIESISDDGNQSLSEVLSLTKNQIIWAVRQEMAITVEDVMARRSRSLFLNAKESLALAPKVAQIMATELQKDQTWVAEQIADFEATGRNYILA